MLDTIQSDVVYQHEKQGEVLVTAVGEMHTNYDVSESTGKPDSRLVFYYNNFDGYGGVNPSPMTQPVNEFVRQADRIRPHEYLGSELLED
jgi:hypothetical protein